MRIDRRFLIISLLLTGFPGIPCHFTIMANRETSFQIITADEAPVLDKIESDDLVYEKGIGAIQITSTLTVSDADSRNLRSATVQFTAGFSSSEDILRFTNQNGITGSWSQTTGVLTLTGRSSVTNYRTALRSIKYENTNKLNPSLTKRTVSFRVYDGGVYSNTVSRNIVIKSANLAPVLSGIETIIPVYCVQSGATAITSTLRIEDGDNSMLVSAVVQITAGYTPNEDFLRFTDQNGISGAWNSSTGALSLSGSASVDYYTSALRSIQYENTDLVNPEAGNHTFSFTVNDGKNASNTVSRSILVHERVSAVLNGSASFCNEESISAPLSIDFSGKAPWTFTITRNNANDVTYNNISADPYSFDVKNEGIYRIKSISDAHCKGDTLGSGYASIIYKPSPTAIIKGIDSICPGETASLQISLTGTAPWSIAYRRNGGTSVAISGITGSNYTLQVNQTGTYTLARVEDAICRGKVSGEGIVRSHSIPTASITGSTSICEHEIADLKVALTGVSPWKFSYRRNAGTPIEVPNVSSSPATVSVQQAGTYTLYEVYDKHCKGTVSGSATVTLIPAPDVTISGLEPVYNHQSVEWVPITGTPAGGTFSGPGVIPYNQNWYFVPSLPPVGTHHVVYAFQETPESCFGYDTAVVRVLEANAIIEFENNRKQYCLNDHPFTVTGINMVGVTGSFAISGGSGLVDHHNNKATVYPSQLAAGEYTITYTYTNGSVFSVNSRFDIGHSPAADFRWETECYQAGQSITLTNTSSSVFGMITSYNWRIYKTTGFDTYSTRNVTHTFPDAGNHSIELLIRTSYGCSDTVTKVFGLKPIIKLADTTYFENFANNPLEWQSGTPSETTVNSWLLGNPTKGFSGEHCWYTYIPGATAPHEHSWVTSPCYDFTGTRRPMLKMDIWRLFNLDRDGAAIMYSTDSMKTWKVLGELDDGVRWYNDYQIDGKPGDQSLGWSNYNGTGNDIEWKEARHSLDVLKNESKAQFRIVYGSDGTARNNNGFAFDNVWIGERNRTALLEHFTNASDETCDSVNVLLNRLTNENIMNIIDLQYHTSFPGADPFNQQNPTVPGARVFYYGLSDVPYTVLDGGSKSTHRFDHDVLRFNPNTILVESLFDSKFSITLKSKVSGTTLNTEAQVFALKDIPATQLTVQLAVIELLIKGETGNNGETSFESVVKALLPDAGGTTIHQEWKMGEFRTVEAAWELQHIYDEKQLRVVAFIQDESTREVYQAVLDTIGVFIPVGDNYIPGSHPGKLYIVYPNPAHRIVHVEFYQATTEDITVELYNNLGGLVFVKHIPPGNHNTDIPTDSYPDGLYILRLVSRSQLIGIDKLTLSKGY